MIKPYWLCSCDEVMNTLPQSRQAIYKNYLWEPGQRIGVAWSGGSYGLRDAVAAIAEEWPASIDWDWGADWNDADIRVELFGRGGWSYIGAVAKQVRRGSATMRLGWAQWAFDNDDLINLRALVLHEFGHALGLVHEHLHPANTLDWNLSAMRAYYVDTLGWKWGDVERTWLTRLDDANHFFRPYNSPSVMHYPVERRFLLSGAGVPFAWNLSGADRDVVADLYPGKISNKIYLPVV